MKTAFKSAVFVVLLLCAFGKADPPASVAMDEFDDFDDLQAAQENEAPIATTTEDTVADETIPQSEESASAESDPKPRVRLSVMQRFTVYEWSGLGWIIACLVVYLAGRPLNYGVAKKFSGHFAEFFHGNFSHITPARPLSSLSSEPPQPSTDRPLAPGTMMFARDSSSIFQSWVSGRKSVFGGLVTLETTGRHDMYSMLHHLVLPPARSRGMDVVTLEFALRNMEPFVLAMIPKSEVSNVKDTHSEFGRLGEVRNNPELSKLAGTGGSRKHKQFVVLSDAAEIANQLLRDSFIKLFKTSPDTMDLVHSIIVSDNNTVPIGGFEKIPAQVARFTFRMPDSSKWDLVAQLLDVAVALVDEINTYKAPKAAKQKCVEARRKLLEEAQKKQSEARMEEAEKKRQEKKQQEKREYESLSADAKAKKDRKEEKRKLKKAQKSRVRVKMA